MEDPLQNFPYEAHADPTVDWAIEHMLQWCFQQSTSKTYLKQDDLILQLQELFDTGEKEVLDIHRTISDTQTLPESDENEKNHHSSLKNTSCNIKEKDDENSKSRSQDAVEETSDKISSINKPHSIIKGINVLIMSGPYKGTEYIVRPRLRKPCFIGRSTGKKFRDRGISLPEDSEVSTTHGKFIMKTGDTFCYVDTGSTNGTLFKGAELKSNDQLEIEEGLEITVGAGVLKMTFCYE